MACVEHGLFVAEGPNTCGDMDLDTRKDLGCMAWHLGLTLGKREPCLVCKQDGTLIKLPLCPGGE